MKDYSALTLTNAIPDLCVIGDDICIAQYINCDYAFPKQFLLKDFLVIYLKEGTLSGKMNGEEHSYSAPCLLTLSSSNIYEYQSATENVDAVIMSFSSAFTNRLNIFKRFQLNEILNDSPVLQLNDESIALIERFVSNLYQLGRNPQNPYLGDALLHLVLYFFYGIGYYYYQTQHSNSRSQQIVDEFLCLLDKFGVEKRNIAFYADQLHLSSKYIQILVKRSTGRSAYSWIEDALLNEAKRLLAENQITIQQIADKLKFCDQSYFGAFFKRMTGITPKKYRTNLLKKGI